MRIAPVLLVSLLFASLLLVSCGAPSPAPTAPQASAKPAPGFELPDLTGKTVKLSDSAGTVRLVDFWATWCAPCREEIPMFKDLHARYGSRGLTLIGIAMDDEGGSVVEPFVRENGMPYLNLLGNEAVASAWGPLRGLPTKFLVDKDGNIVETFFGPVPPKVLERKIESLL
jgi:thiol-disulfide isomerase/thioredoxin